MAQLASALRSGRRGRPFEPDHPDKKAGENLPFFGMISTTPCTPSRGTAALRAGHQGALLKKAAILVAAFSVGIIVPINIQGFG